MELSKNYTLDQFTRSEIGSRLNIKEQFAPPQLVVAKLTALCVHLLEPLRAVMIKKFPTASHRITSGYRCPIVNHAAGGSDSSQHPVGEASDNEMLIDGKEHNLELAKLVIDNNLDFDQMILEYGTMEKPDWIHLSWDLDKGVQRKMILRVDYDKEGKKRTYQITPSTVINTKAI